MIEGAIFSIPEELSGSRIDKCISLLVTDITRSRAQQLIEDGNITVNGKKAGKSLKVVAGDRVCIDLPEPEPIEALPENIPLDIRYEDDYLLVVNKPKDMVVHPAAGNYTGTLVNALLYHCGDSLSGINGVMRPGIVHRIDKDTSGLLMVAKNDFAHRSLAQQIKEHSFRREYQAVVYGRFKEPQGTVDAPIGRNPSDRKKMAVTMKNSRNAVTHYEVIKERWGRYRIDVQIVTESPDVLPDGAVMQRYSELLEKTIQKQPQFWMWSHRRWKPKFQNL